MIDPDHRTSTESERDHRFPVGRGTPYPAVRRGVGLAGHTNHHDRAVNV